jgi:enamine deaminase RidA (YjgF/YER057c/UK114 family)
MPKPEHFTLNEKSARAAQASDAVWVGGLGFVSGVLPVDLDDDRVALPEAVEDQTRKVLANLETLLKARGLNREHVVSVRIHLVDMKRFLDRVDKAYAGFFPAGRLPARSCVGVSGLTRQALVGMDFIVKEPS